MSGNLGDAINQSLVAMDDVDTAIRQSFGVRMRLGHFDQPGPLQKVEQSVLCDPDAIELARDGKPNDYCWRSGRNATQTPATTVRLTTIFHRPRVTRSSRSRFGVSSTLVPNRISLLMNTNAIIAGSVVERSPSAYRDTYAPLVSMMEPRTMSSNWT